MSIKTAKKALFSSGSIVGTNLSMFTLTAEQLTIMLDNHFTGDWGVVCEEDAYANEQALINGERILSKYIFNDLDYYVITEWDRSCTTVMLTEEY